MSLILDELGLDALERAFGAGPVQLLFGYLEFGPAGIEMRPSAILTGGARQSSVTSLIQDEPIVPQRWPGSVVFR